MNDTEKTNKRKGDEKDQCPHCGENVDEEPQHVLKKLRPAEEFINFTPQVIRAPRPKVISALLAPGDGPRGPMEMHFIQKIELGDGAALFRFHLSNDELGTLHQDMRDERPDEYEHFQFMGKTVKHPRKMKAYGRSYFFSGRRHTAAALQDTPKSLLDTMKIIEEVCRRCDSTPDVKFNSALVNWYANGHEYIAKHSDDERDLVAPPTVATLTLGQERVFRVRRKSDNAIVKDVKLQHGSVYIMYGANFQKQYTHEVPKVSGKKGDQMKERISVTLRQHKNE